MGDHYKDFLEREQVRLLVELANLHQDLSEYKQSLEYWETRTRDAELELHSLREIVKQSTTVCGRHNCNCPGAKPVRVAIDAYRQTYLNETIPKNEGKR